MIELAATRGVAVVRVDFSNDDAWSEIEAQLAAEDYSGTGYEPNLTSVERPDLSTLSVEEIEAQLSRRYPDDDGHPFVIVFDAVAISDPEHPVLLVDLAEDDTAPSFRALPREIAAIEANLSIANLDFSDFGDNAGPDGVFRGFG